MTRDGGHERALLHSWHKERGWGIGTGQLHDVSGGYVCPECVFLLLSRKMYRLAMQFVNEAAGDRPKLCTGC